jgi:gamma-glutamyltranspeptidase/glutathione hydrolase
LLAPAIRIAEAGYAVSPVVAHKWAAAVPELKDQPGYADTFMPNGRAPTTGEWFRAPGHAATLRRLAEHGAQDFYRGELGERLAAAARLADSALTGDDLGRYEVEWVEPIAQAYRGHTVHEMPPNGQGLAALIALGICARFDLRSLGAESVDAHHIQIEAMKLAFADAYEHIADGRFMRVAPERFLEPSYLDARAKRIDPDRAGRFPTGFPRREGTVYLCAADEKGQMVSLIQSNYMGFGSGVVVPGTGISLQNRGVGFSSDPRSANVVAGGKRPFHTIIPAFLSRNGQAVMAFGVMGGDMQPQGHLQTIVRMLDHDQQPQAACDAPRWRVNRNGTVSVEAHMAPALRRGLAERGHDLQAVDDPYMDFGSGQFIARLDEDPAHGYIAASDARRDGQASGF